MAGTSESQNSGGARWAWPCGGMLAALSLTLATLALAAAAAHAGEQIGAEGCPKASDPIATDRPDITNSSLVVPAGSLQSENGLNVSTREGGRVLDGTNTRLRFGVAPCLELLVDLPTYFAAVRGRGHSGFSDVTPAVKWQISPIPGKVDLSATVGVALPTGTTDIAGVGAQPYLQFPWSWELSRSWGVSGMVTTFFRPADPVSKLANQATFVLERKLSERASVFVEYVGDFPEHAGAAHLLNSGAVYRLTPTQQLDFHVAAGLNRNAPSLIVGIGYSFRLDGVLGHWSRR
jgi:hypothetical protein